MVQWTPNVDVLFFKVVLKIHDIKVDYKKAEEALREEGVDVTAKALMHRITKLKNTNIDPAEPGKASPLKAAKRAADGKPKTVIPDPEDVVDGDGDGETEKEKPKSKKAKTGTTAAAKGAKTNGAKSNAAKGKKVVKKVVEEEEDDEMENGAVSEEEEDGVAI